LEYLSLALLKRGEKALDALIAKGGNSEQLKYRQALMLLSFASTYSKLGENNAAFFRAIEAKIVLQSLVNSYPKEITLRMDLVDAGGVQAGAEFAEIIREQVARCDVLVALGPGWNQATDSQSQRRLDRADDLVRTEIASALTAGKRVIPVLVGGALMPAEESLPDDLKPLARRNAFTLTHENFVAECAYLVRQKSS
jgi:hypothetical protein